MRAVLVAIVIFALLLAAVVLWMAGGVQKPKVFHPPPLTLPGAEASSRADDPSVTVVTWNMAWGYGWGSEGSGHRRPKAHFDRTLEAMAEVLKKVDPDVVLLQEVDFDCTRSYRVDQAEYLARAVGLPHVAKAVSWEANWVPFPFWPPEDQFGRMRSGGAILSRFPIEGHRVETVQKPRRFPFWYALFYPFRYHQQATLRSKHGEVLVMNFHADAFDQESRIRHARLIAERLTSELLPYSVVGGDLNTVLPEARVRKAYPDEPDTTHAGDPTLELIRGVDGLVDSVAGEMYATNEEAWFTFPAHEPNRKLDYLFHSAGLRVDEVKVLRALAGELSDHLPVAARLSPLEAPPAKRRLETLSSTTTP